VADARRLYLKLQAELGGPEAYLTAGRPAGRAVRSPEPVPAVGNEPPGEPAAASGPMSSASPRPSDWRKNLPPIPGPGLNIMAAQPGLLDPASPWNSLEAIAAAVQECRKCFLCQDRTNSVPGEGSPTARLLCVGEGPGETEDRTGRPFVGRAGELLTSILASIGLPRETVFIANVVKCRPPQNRKPTPDEMAACLPYLRRQIQLIRPTVILALGATAAEGLLGARSSLGDLRNRVHRFDGIPLIVTYHPAALLRNPNWKKPTWDDVRIARQLLDG
jgi:DNA polymerase